uniref:Uncharacterized protein n=1 Tax=Timema genevievae TaxID=629358 RepID=A0A7R9PRP5_TIMGE|nr:unnamed protein product [Timema genevievae]
MVNLNFAACKALAVEGEVKSQSSNEMSSSVCKLGREPITFNMNLLYLKEVYPHLRGGIVEHYFIQTTLSTLDRDSNLNLPVTGSLVYCESSALDHAATEAVHPTEIRTLISPSSAVELNTTGALANYTTEAVAMLIIMIPTGICVEGEWKTILDKPPSVHPTEIRTLISPSSAGSLVNCVSSALDPVATEASPNSFALSRVKGLVLEIDWIIGDDEVKA